MKIEQSRLQSVPALLNWPRMAGVPIALCLSTISLLHAQQTPQPPTPIPPVKTSITIVERVEEEAPASVTILSKQEVEQQPGVNLDDRLRSVPGFSLFRRSSSVVANPTTQGV